MSGRPILRALAVAASAALLVTALAGPSLAKHDKGPKAAAKVEQKAERQAERQDRAQARAEARVAGQQAKVERKAAKAQAKAEEKAARAERKAQKRAAKQAMAEAKSLCKDGGWRGLVTAEGDPFRNQGQCVKYVVHGGTPRPPETVLAMAYSNLDGTPGYQADGGDVLISQLVDTDGNGVDEGDRIAMGRYPTDLEATAFGDFTVLTHTVTSVGTADQAGFKVYSASGTHVWLDFGNAEMYYEENPLTEIRDGFVGYTEWLSVDMGSASRPATAVSATYPDRPTDDPFIDVDIS